MCESLKSPMELFHDDIQMWVPGGTTLPPAIPSKARMMEIAAHAYWHHQEETVNSDSAKCNHERIYNVYLPLPPCIHNNMMENIDLILKDLEEMRINKVEHNIGPFE